MKILIYSPQFLPQLGGLQYVVDAWARQWSQMGNDITVICKAKNKKQDKFPYRVIRDPQFWKTVEEMRTHDVVVMFNVSLKAMPQLFLARKPLIVSHHSGLYAPGYWYRNIMQRFKKFVAEKIAISHIACSAFTAGAYKKCQVVHSPFKSATFMNINGARERDIIFAGRLVTDKGCDILLEAIAILVQRYKKIYQITIVGDGPEMQRLLKQKTLLKLPNTIIFKGKLDSEQLAIELNNHKIMVVPSRLEPFGIVALEGLACGCKMVLSNIGGLSEAGSTFSRYFASENAHELAVAIEDAYNDQSQDLQNQINTHLSDFTESTTAYKALQYIKRALQKSDNNQS